MMYKRPRPVGGRHPPSLAPTVNSFKPRAQWSTSGSSVFLYVNLPGFYRDQIEIKKDDKTRIIQIQGQRPLSTQTKARFNEAYRVPESCDMAKLNTSFSHGLLTIEFQKVVEGEKPEKAVQNQGKIIQRANQEESESGFGRMKPSDVGTSQEKVTLVANNEEPKTYKSVVEGKRPVPTGSRERFEYGVKAREGSPSLGRKENAQEEKVLERKDAIPRIGQHKTVQKLKEEEARTMPPTIGSNLKPKVYAKDQEKVTERKKDNDLGQNSKTRIINAGLESKVQARVEKVNERKGDGEMGQKVKDEKRTNPVVSNVARKPNKEIAATNHEKTELETKERIAHNDNDNVIRNYDKKNEKKFGDNGSGGEIQEKVKQKSVEEVKETGDVKENAEVVEPEKVDSDDHVKEESKRVGENREKAIGKSLESETDPLLVEEGQKKTGRVPTAVGGSERRGMNEEESQEYDLSLVNVGVAALVIMGFGAYAFVPLVKLFY